MCPPSELADWTSSSMASHRSGTMRNGIVSSLPALALRTREIVSGLLPTPAARDFRDLSSGATPYPSQLRRNSPSLATLLYKRSEEHTSELQSLMRISYAVFCL